MKQCKHILEAALVYMLYGLFHILPLDAASAFGGWLAGLIGPRMRAHTIACNNLAMMLPDYSPQERRKIAMEMWDNIGRVIAEMPHLRNGALYKRLTIHGMEHLPLGRQALYFSGHIGNWELAYPMAHHNDIPIMLIYRQINNPYVEKLVAKVRRSQSSALVSKGPRNAFKMIRGLKTGMSVAMLIDQKMNEGIEVPFFGHPAMTAPAIAELALRYNIPLVPVRIIRRRGAYFDAYIYPPLAYENTGHEAKDAKAIMTEVNRILESWIRECPAQWFWVHRRWPKDIVP